MLLIIDNYDSFVMNIVHYLELPHDSFMIIRNDQISINDIKSGDINAIIISPGPMSPEQAGVSNDIIRCFAGKIPILGICLGFECIGCAYGGILDQCPNIVHGRSDRVYLEKSRLFQGLPDVIEAARYHSLHIVDNGLLSPELNVIARLDDGMIMGVEHKTEPLFGLLFHPESILTKENGKRILHNFISISHQWNQQQIKRRTFDECIIGGLL